tara:strand:+ start:2214 stop:2444 length:231 start_codon:yes stop_codon:yes gene_type:complete
MSQGLRIDGIEYGTEGLSKEGMELIERLKFTRHVLSELTNQQAILTKAKNAYISDLKMEIVQGRTGVDLGALLSDD